MGVETYHQWGCDFSWCKWSGFWGRRTHRHQWYNRTDGFTLIRPDAGEKDNSDTAPVWKPFK